MSWEDHKPPSSAIAWAGLWAIIMGAAAGGLAYGKMDSRIVYLERFDPIMIDRRIAALEDGLEHVTEQLKEVGLLIERNAALMQSNAVLVQKNADLLQRHTQEKNGGRLGADQ